MCAGVSGITSDGYLMHFINHALSRGFRVAFINHRGLSPHGQQELKSARAYCATTTDDVRTVMKHLKQAYPGMAFAGVSWSMGMRAVRQSSVDVMITCRLDDDDQVHCRVRGRMPVCGRLVGMIRMLRSELNSAMCSVMGNVWTLDAFERALLRFPHRYLYWVALHDLFLFAPCLYS